MRRLALFSLLAAVAAAGCKGPDDDLAPAFVPKAHAFEGEVDPRLAGTWVSADGASTLGLAKDGTLKIQTVTPSPSGKSTSSLEGRWLASRGSLLMRYGASGQGSTVLKYSSTLSKGELRLKPEGSGRETTYRRK